MLSYAVRVPLPRAFVRTWSSAVLCAACAIAGCGSEAPGFGAGSAAPPWSSAPTTSSTSGAGGAGGRGGALAAPFTPALGAHYDETGDFVDFRVASMRATRVEVWIYAEPHGQDERLRVVLDADGSTWSGRVAVADLAAAGVTGPVLYGYRVWGPNWPWVPEWTPGSDAGRIADVDDDGNRMNPNKLVIDPYALELSHDPTGPWFGDAGVYSTKGDNRSVDSGRWAPKGIVVAAPSQAEIAEQLGVAKPSRALKDDLVYEVHLRGLTRNDASLGACAGTYAGAAAWAERLADLGVTAVELLPVHETWNDGNDVDPESAAGDNYWGYSTLAFLSPDRRYACDRTPGGPTREVRAMTRAFHELGIKVLVDVVYNHTAEGGGSSLLSLRGIDNAAYYELDDSGHGFFDSTGIGANTAATSPIFRDLVIDSLRYWADNLGVDGFRFDLAPVLGNTCAHGCFHFDASAPGNVLVRAAAELPARPAEGGAGVDLVAEPWALGPGTYQIGAFPPGWSEWNGQYRDLVRADQNRLGVVAVTPGWLSDRLSGSPELFADDDRPPSASVNFVASHDGFTLRDVYACNDKNNGQAWPWGPSNGGSNDNLSWDQTGDASRQRQAARTGLALLLVSAGVPMITGGDEVYRTQKCNNNPYNLDSPAIALDPEGAAAHPEFAAFARRMIRFRHDHPALRPAQFRTEADISWRGADGKELTGAYLDDAGEHLIAFLVAGAAYGDPARSIYVVYNGGTASVAATLPPHDADTHWFRVADTAAWLEPEGNAHEPGDEYQMKGSVYDVASRSLALFVER